MKLYSVTQNGGGYDCNNGFVIRAKSPAEARKIASNAAADEGYEVWLDPEKSDCEVIKIEGESEIICTDFHAG